MKMPKVNRELFPPSQATLLETFIKNPTTFSEQTKVVKDNKVPRSKMEFQSGKKKGCVQKNRPTFNFHGLNTEPVRAGGIVPMVYKDLEIYLLLRKIVNPLTGKWYYEDNGGKSDKKDKSYQLMQVREFCEETDGKIQDEDFSMSSSDSEESQEEFIYNKGGNKFSILEISDRHPTFEQKIKYRTTVNDICNSIKYVTNLMSKNPKVDVYTKVMKYVVTFLKVPSDFMEQYPSEAFGNKEIYEDIERTIEWVPMTEFLEAITQGNVHTRLSYNFDLKIRDNFKSFVNCFGDEIWKKDNLVSKSISL